jgi:hypothetical protein
MKVGADVITDDNFKDHLSIQLLSGSQSLNEFHAAITNLYIPLLSSRADDATRKLLQDLRLS